MTRLRAARHFAERESGGMQGRASSRSCPHPETNVASQKTVEVAHKLIARLAPPMKEREHAKARPEHSPLQLTGAAGALPAQKSGSRQLMRMP